MRLVKIAATLLLLIATGPAVEMAEALDGTTGQTSATTTGPARAPTSQPASAMPNAELMHALRLIREKQFDRARSKIEPLVAAYPEWSRAWLMLAMTYHEEQRYGMARPLFAKALALNPNDHNARPFYGWCLYYLGAADEARAQFEAFLKVNPQYADAHFAIGLIEYDDDNLDEAMRRFNRTIEIAKMSKDPRTEGKARARSADVHIRRNELTQARDELESAVRLRPDAYEAYHKLSRVYERLGNRSKAEQARRMHDEIRERMHPTSQPMGGAPETRD
ncbi:MAG: tetratricopeptide repeat protein [Phycisphaerae bacterium]|nr:tetratricopeptide repeat protein [Phycisphaerae bacterium]